jgi:phosphonate transport system ATP-binding protein
MGAVIDMSYVHHRSVALLRLSINTPARHGGASSMLSIEGLSREFSGRKALDSLTLAIQPGEFVGVIGRSGAGKSTLLRLINRLVEPSAGRIRWDDVEVTALRGRELRQWRARCAMVFQQFNLVGRLDVLTNVLMGRLTTVPTWRALLTLWSDADKLDALETLDRFGMADFAAQRCDQLSGGQQQRVGIARALVQQPKLILADEPVASLDPATSEDVMRLMVDVARSERVALVVNLHQVDLARDFCDRIVGLRGGRVVLDGPADSFSSDDLQSLYGGKP